MQRLLALPTILPEGKELHVNRRPSGGLFLSVMLSLCVHEYMDYGSTMHTLIIMYAHFVSQKYVIGAYNSGTTTMLHLQSSQGMNYLLN